jgi:hypothetical protein
MLRKTPAREAGTWWIPQFQSSVVVAVQSRPLMASADPGGGADVGESAAAETL